MAKKSKAFLRRSTAAKKGWATRRRKLKILTAPTTPKPQERFIFRTKYLDENENEIDIEIERIGLYGDITKVRIGKGKKRKTYTKKSDIEAFAPLLVEAFNNAVPHRDD